MCRVPWGSAGVLGPVVPRVRVVPAGSLVPPVLWGRQGRGVERVRVCRLQGFLQKRDEKNL